MMSRIFTACTISVSTLLVALFLGDAACAQNFTVQQPVFERFSVGTTVSVPDRGRALLGSVSRAGVSRKNFGPFRSGTNTGMFRDHSSASSHVFIHDLRAMDESLLQQRIRSNAIPRGPALSSHAEHAYRRLISRHRAADAPSAISHSQPRTVNVGEAERFFQLGLRAEKRGRHSLARLHFRAAAQHGSQRAKARHADSLVAKP